MRQPCLYIVNLYLEKTVFILKQAPALKQTQGIDPVTFKVMTVKCFKCYSITYVTMFMLIPNIILTNDVIAVIRTTWKK